MQQSTHSELHMAGQHVHRNHTLYSRLQEHHVILSKLPFLIISTHGFIRSNLIIPPPSSLCQLFTSSYSRSFCYAFMSLGFSVSVFIWLFSPNLILNLLSFQRSPFNLAITADILSTRKPRKVVFVILNIISYNQSCQ